MTSDPTSTKRPTVLIVDDEIDIRTMVRLVLEASEHNIQVVAEAVDGLEALDAFARLDPPVIPDVVILDNRMPGLSGLEVAESMLGRHASQHIVLYSAHLTREIVAKAKEIGIDQCVSKEVVDRLPEIVTALATSKDP